MCCFTHKRIKHHKEIYFKKYESPTGAQFYKTARMYIASQHVGIEKQHTLEGAIKELLVFEATFL